MCRPCISRLCALVSISAFVEQLLYRRIVSHVHYLVNLALCDLSRVEQVLNYAIGVLHIYTLRNVESPRQNLHWVLSQLLINTHHVVYIVHHIKPPNPLP